MGLLQLENNPLILQGSGGGGGICTVTITCAAPDTKLAYFSPDCVWHMDNLRAGANVFQVLQNSPIFVYNMYGYPLTNLVNIVSTGSTVLMSNDSVGRYVYTIYYATASTANATQPTD